MLEEQTTLQELLPAPGDLRHSCKSCDKHVESSKENAVATAPLIVRFNVGSSFVEEWCDLFAPWAPKNKSVLSPYVPLTEAISPSPTDDLPAASIVSVLSITANGSFTCTVDLVSTICQGWLSPSGLRDDKTHPSSLRQVKETSKGSASLAVCATASKLTDTGADTRANA
jgi:hypothetical protein